MRYRFFIVLLAFASAMYSQEFMRVFSLCNSPELIVQNKTRYNPATKSKERIYINNDHCSYMVVRKGARYYNAFPGENLVESRPVQSQASEGNFSKTEYHYYRGIFPKNEPADGYYALPLAIGDSILIEPHMMRDRNSERTENYLSFSIQNNDTVYAMRGGVACLVGDKKGVIVNHIDETFAVYYHMRRALVQPGDAVEVGQPVGLVASGKVYVGFVYLDEKYFKQKEVAVEYPYTHFVPQLWDGEQFFQPGEMAKSIVVPTLTTDLITQDMTKAQKKRYLKGKK